MTARVFSGLLSLDGQWSLSADGTFFVQTTLENADLAEIARQSLVKDFRRIRTESARIILVEGGPYVLPTFREPLRDAARKSLERLGVDVRTGAVVTGIDDDGVPFHVKKEVTSALRRLAPIGLSTDIVWTANVRTLRHVIEMRTAPGAEEELRLVFDQIARIMKSEAPNLFQDFKRLDDGTWAPEFRKV